MSRLFLWKEIMIEMTDNELVLVMEEVSQTQENHSAFYELAEQAGFCTPWCHISNDCGECEKK